MAINMFFQFGLFLVECSLCILAIEMNVFYFCFQLFITIMDKLRLEIKAMDEVSLLTNSFLYYDVAV